MNILRITRLRLLIIVLIIAMIVANGIYAWYSYSSTSQIPSRFSASFAGANLSQVVGVESVAMGVFEDGRLFGVLRISNYAGENMTVTGIYSRAVHVYFTDNTSMDTDAEANTAMDLSIKPGEYADVKVALSDHSFDKGVAGIRLDFTIRIKEAQDPLVVRRFFLEDMGPAG